MLQIYTRLYGVPSHKTICFVDITERFSNLTKFEGSKMRYTEHVTTGVLH